jgi:N6-L-threonylcarbamoyladenine synthase
VVDSLSIKTKRAILKYQPESLLLGGGVAANYLLRKLFRQKINIPLFIPPPKLCTDNAAMIAQAAYFKKQRQEFIWWQKIKADPNLSLK